MTDDLRGEIVAVTVPKWGLSMEDGAIVEWHVAEGDVVEDGPSPRSRRRALMCTLGNWLG